MKWVIDASFVAGLFLPDEMSEKLASLARELVKGEAVAPALMQLEVTNILLTAARRKRITAAQLKQLSEAFDQLPIVYHAALTSVQRAEVVRLAQKLTLTVYEAAYLELAMRLGVALVSLDKSLVRAANAEGVEMPRGLH